MRVTCCWRAPSGVASQTSPPLMKAIESAEAGAAMTRVRNAATLASRSMAAMLSGEDCPGFARRLPPPRRRLSAGANRAGLSQGFAVGSRGPSCGTRSCTGMVKCERSSRTTTPPWASQSRAASGPLRTAALARHSASTAVGASAVAWTTPVKAGRPVAGSSRWWAGRPSRRRASCAGRCRIVATAPVDSRKRCSGAPPNGSATATVRSGPRSGRHRRSRRRSSQSPRAARRSGRRTGPWPGRRCRTPAPAGA